MLALGGGLRWDAGAGAGALADCAWVPGVRPRGQHGGEAGDVCQGLGVVLSSHAGRLHVHASQQSPVARHHTQNLLRGPLLLPLFGSSVLKPNLLRRGRIREVDRVLDLYRHHAEPDRIKQSLVFV